MAEDDPTICLIIPMILRRLGHEVDVVRDGREAITEFTAKPQSTTTSCFTDHGMPVVTGLELVDHLRANGFNGKIVVMSGSLTDDLMYAYLAKRVDKILQKPFTLEMLSTTLSHLLAQRREEHREREGV